MPQAFQKLDSTVEIGGQRIPFLKWVVHQGSYGSASSCEIEADKKALDAAGINLVQMSTSNSAVPIDIRVSNSNSGNVHIFGGGLDSVRYILDENRLEIEGRDWSAKLIDQKTILNTNQQNMTPDKLAAYLAQQAGLTANTVAPPANVNVGSIYKNNAINSPQPQPAWQIIQYLARAVGFETNVTADKVLYFGPPQTNQTLTCGWRMPAQTSGNINVVPIRSLHITHQPRRNRTFQVIVMSYHPKTAQMTKGIATVTGDQNGAAGSSGTVKAGFYTGAAGASTSSSLSSTFGGGSNSGTSDSKPVYYKHVEGKTAEQCQQLAQGIANDIAKRELVVTGTLDGNPTLSPQTPLQLQEANTNDLANFALKNMMIVAVTHTYVQPQKGGHENSGYTTEITANNLPPQQETT